MEGRYSSLLKTCPTNSADVVIVDVSWPRVRPTETKEGNPETCPSKDASNVENLTETGHMAGKSEEVRKV